MQKIQPRLQWLVAYLRRVGGSRRINTKAMDSHIWEVGAENGWKFRLGIWIPSALIILLLRNYPSSANFWCGCRTASYASSSVHFAPNFPNIEALADFLLELPRGCKAIIFLGKSHSKQDKTPRSRINIGEAGREQHPLNSDLNGFTGLYNKINYTP